MLTEQQQRAKDCAKVRLSGGTYAAVSSVGGVAGAPPVNPAISNIIGVGIGAKISAGITTEQNAVRIYVRVKIPRNQLRSAERIPDEFENMPTDVIEVGDVTVSQTVPTWARRQRHRPTTSCGVSIGHPNITAGTLGCLVEKNNRHYILSNNHVLADVNQAHSNDAIIQQATADGGTSPADDIATLSDFKRIDLTGAANDIDAAIAEVGPDTQTTVEPEIIAIGRPKPQTKPAVLYQSVRKHERTTGHTIGVVVDLSADLWVDVGSGRQAWFEDQIAIVGIGGIPFSQGGDSGSLIVDAVTLEPTGLLFAGGNSLTFANHIDQVLAHFNVAIVG